ncbi:hypothetical protein [Colwellia psychrerythraea]|uniref:Uncharacterized protein n=1 Tax=Colwellia psychrerythraea TaxID=28229 RepID=A0A099KC53_COLPS|nr:hypothetical protein [Colwellia psychrerythraea]KGJ87946.1 hypothetical protein GAB14E_4279 [Colwellia psychrerythraea]
MKRLTRKLRICHALVGVAGFISTLLFSEQLIASEDYPCANEGEACLIAQPLARSAVSYGAEDAYYTIEVEGMDRVSCTSGVMGDPNIGVHKKCYTRVLTDFQRFTDWTHCANENEICDTSTGKDTPVKVRFGVPGHWVYTWASSGHNCNAYDDIELDPKFGTVKYCEYSPSSAMNLNFTTCAAEGQVCHIPQGSENIPSVIRYGSGNNFTYRAYSGTNLPCTLGSFNHDPSPWIQKICGSAKTDTKSITNIRGRWVPLTWCDGCSSTSYKVTHGIKEGTSTAKSSSWTESLASEISLSGGFKTPISESSSSVTITSKLSVSETSTATNSFSYTETETTTYECPYNLWQWRTTVTENQYDIRGASHPTNIVATASLFKCQIFAPVLVEFDVNFYRNYNSDLTQFNDEQLLHHWINHGKSELRQAVPDFHARHYIQTYPDLMTAFGENYELIYDHWRNFGIKEGRQASYQFNVREYLINHPEQDQVSNQRYIKAYNHWRQHGRFF